MERIRTTIYLDKDIYEKIRVDKINLSKKINNLLRNEFFSHEAKLQEIAEIEERLKKLKNETKQEG